MEWLDLLRHNPAKLPGFLVRAAALRAALEAALNQPQTTPPRSAPPARTGEEDGAEETLAAAEAGEVEKDDAPLGTRADDFYRLFKARLVVDYPRAVAPTLRQATTLWEFAAAGGAASPDDAIGVYLGVLHNITRNRNDAYTWHVQGLTKAVQNNTWEELVNEAEAVQRVIASTVAGGEAERRRENARLAAAPPAPSAPDQSRATVMAQLRARRDALVKGR